VARTRSAGAHKKVLEAALALVAERGIEATSMDAIARASGVSEATIYKHWADKDALMLEMLAEVTGLRTRPSFDTGDTRADIVAVLAYRSPEDGGMRDRIMPYFAAYSASNVAFGLAWRNTVMEPPRRELRRLLEQGIEKGELSPDLNMDHSLALLLGPLLYWYIFLRRTLEDPKPLAENIVSAFWSAFRRPSQSRQKKG
jgi:AcrR family transcriptional regulator